MRAMAPNTRRGLDCCLSFKLDFTGRREAATLMPHSYWRQRRPKMCASVYGSKADSLKRSAFSHKRALVGAFDPDRLEVHRGAGGRHLGHADLFPSVDFVKKTKQPLRTIRNGPHCLRSNMLHEGKHGVIEVKDLQKSYGELMAFGIALLGAGRKVGSI